MGGPIGKSTFAHGEPVGPWLQVQTSPENLSSSKLKEAFKKFAEEHSLVMPGSADNDINVYMYVEKKTGVSTVQQGIASDGCLHVFDLGDGMLVPCQLVEELF